MKRPIDHSVFEHHINNPGRPKKLTESDEKNICAGHHLRISIGSFTAKRLRTEAGVPATTSMWTTRRVLNWHGYWYLQSCRKDMLTRKDAYKRLKFARRMKRLSSSTLHQFLLWWDVICAQDKSLCPSPSSEITRTENKEWRVSSVLYIKKKESWRPREGYPFLSSYHIQERGYMLRQIYSRIEWWVFCILHPQRVSFAFSSQHKPKSNTLFTRWWSKSKQY